MLLRASIAALVLAVAGTARADVLGYSEAFDTLYRVNLTTHTAQEIGPATPAGVTRYPILDGLTFSPDGKLYAVADGGTKILLQISTGTGLATPIGALNLGTTQRLDLGLAFTADGKLWMSSGPGSFWQVDPNNASVRLVGNVGLKLTGLTSRGNALYGAGGQGNNNLYQIDQTTAKATLIGPYGPSVNYVSAASPAFDATGQLWVVLDYVPPQSGSTTPDWSDLARSDASGTLTNVGAITPANSQSTNDLQQIGLRGLAIVAPAAATVDSTPALSINAMLSLAALLALIAGTRLRRRHPMR